MGNDGKIVPIRCPFCGSKLGKVESEADSRVWFHCSRCREDLGTSLRDGRLTFVVSAELLNQVQARA